MIGPVVKTSKVDPFISTVYWFDRGVMHSITIDNRAGRRVCEVMAGRPTVAQLATALWKLSNVGRL